MGLKQQQHHKRKLYYVDVPTLQDECKLYVLQTCTYKKIKKGTKEINHFDILGKGTDYRYAFHYLLGKKTFL